MFTRIVAITVFAVTAVCVAFPALSADLAKRKLGLWQVTTQSGGHGTMTMQVCVDEKNQDVTVQQTQARKMCPKIDTKRTGGHIEVDSVCKIEGTTVTSHAVITGDLSSQYTMNQTSHFSPPLQGMSETQTAITAKWLGPCQPGQQNGVVSIQRMPGGGNIQISPEMMKQIQKMQQQYQH